MKTARLVIASFGFAVFAGCAGPSTGDTAECIVASDDDISALTSSGRSCDFLNVEHPTMSSLQGLESITTVRSLRIRESPLLTQISAFVDLQPDLGAISVIGSPVENTLDLSPSNLGSVTLEGTLVRELVVSSPALDSLFLTNNPVDSVAVVSLRDLRIEDVAMDTLVAFDSVTGLNRMTVRRTSLASSTIDAFIARQTSTPVVEHCGNADDGACDEVTELDPG